MSKNEEGKAEPTLVYWSMIEGLARVRAYGIKKYGKSEDWRTTKSIRHFDAALRHIFAALCGEERDEQSGLPHLYHAAANIMFEIERRYGQQRTRGAKILGDRFVNVTCPRCHATEEYPLSYIGPCVGECGYIIETVRENYAEVDRNK
jgi:hypothetical protein